MLLGNIFYTNTEWSYIGIFHQTYERVLPSNNQAISIDIIMSEGCVLKSHRVTNLAEVDQVSTIL
jgi:hypothetical protein